MKTHKLQKPELEKAVLSLRNHRLKVITAIFVVGFPLIFFSGIPFGLYLGTWLFYMVAGFIAIRPNWGPFRITSITLSNKILKINSSNKQTEFELAKVSFVTKKRNGLHITKSFLRTYWIPSTIDDFDKLFDQLKSTLPQKVFSQFRNPMVYLLIMTILPFGSMFFVDPISSISAFLATLTFVVFYE